jgi:hypothetical protein
LVSLLLLWLRLSTRLSILLHLFIHPLPFFHGFVDAKLCPQDLFIDLLKLFLQCVYGLLEFHALLVELILAFTQLFAIIPDCCNFTI